MSEERTPPSSDKRTKREGKLLEWFSRVLELALLGALVVIGDLQYRTYNRQAGLMQTQTQIAGIQAVISNRQADIMDRQNDIAAIGQRAFVSAKEVHLDKIRNPMPGVPDQFETSLWFYPMIENGGNTATKDMRISVQAAVDPSRTDVALKLPFGFALGQKQSIEVSHLPDAGPPDPEPVLNTAERLDNQGKPSALIRNILGPHVSQAIGGFGVPLDQLKQHIRDGMKLFLLGAIHYDDRIAGSPHRLYKYCFVIGFNISESDDFQPAIGPCPHWNCADDECDRDKSAYEVETKGWVAPAMFSLPASSPPYPAPPAAETPK